MKYSIIIPTLNEEKLLPALLASLCDRSLKKTYDYEIIVSDGGSTDRTIEIAEEYCDKTLRYRPGEVRSISACRAKGARCSSGDYVVFINADVRLDIGKLFSEAESKLASSNYVAMTCPIRCVPELENLKDRCFSTVVNAYYHFSNKIGLGIARGECQLIKRRVYENVGGYKEEIVVGEDFELFSRIRKHGRVLFTTAVTVYESPRRYQSWGYFKTVAAWLLTSGGRWFSKKPFYDDWEPIR